MINNGDELVICGVSFNGIIVIFAVFAVSYTVILTSTTLRGIYYIIYCLLAICAMMNSNACRLRKDKIT